MSTARIVADLLFREAFEAGQQEGLARQRRDLAEADLGRQVALDLLAAGRSPTGNSRFA